jgi:hypothetical protein
MNRRLNSCKHLVALWLPAVFAATSPAAAAPVAKPAAPEPELVAMRSVFVVPVNPAEGRDPFFPTSTRPYEAAVAASVQGSDFTLFILKGISGPPDHRLAIVNNRTLAAGEEADIVTRQGRIHLRCVEIRTNSVVIESGGQSHELTYVSKH